MLCPFFPLLSISASILLAAPGCVYLPSSTTWSGVTLHSRLHPHSSPSRTTATAILAFFSFCRVGYTYYLLRTRRLHLFDRLSRRWTSGRRVFAGRFPLPLSHIPHIPILLLFFFHVLLMYPQLCDHRTMTLTCCTLLSQIWQLLRVFFFASAIVVYYNLIYNRPLLVCTCS